MRHLIGWLFRRARRLSLPYVVMVVTVIFLLLRLHRSTQSLSKAKVNVEAGLETNTWQDEVAKVHVEALLQEFRRSIAPVRKDSSNCSLPDLSNYPLCESKKQWLTANWNTAEYECLVQFGVDGSECTLVRYLSDIEGFCPASIGHVRSLALGNWSDVEENQGRRMDVKLDDVLKQLAGLLDGRQSAALQWMQQRIAASWSKWSLIGRSRDFQSLRKSHILVHLGLLATDKWQIGEAAFSGGPLGELVGWSDLLGALFALGHTVFVSANVHQLQTFVESVSAGEESCRSPKWAGVRLDLFYTDLVGLLDAKRAFREHLAPLLCRIRVLDSFGTQPKYNDLIFAHRHRLVSGWNPNGLHAAQFLTMFPHTPDNSFLGFAVYTHWNHSEGDRERGPIAKSRTGKAVALIYGKTLDCWFEKGTSEHVSVVAEYFDVHATVSDPDASRRLPPFVTNHGVVSQAEMSQLYDEARVFVGLGFPFEGPAPLEALAHGCTFINPKFAQPVGRDSHPFFADKPTSRKLASQHPYLDRFVGAPHVFTVDVRNSTHLRSLLRSIASSDKPKAFTPFEFTYRGFLERLVTYQSAQAQHLCPLKFAVERDVVRLRRLNATLWPPAHCVNYYVGEPGQSCETVCARSGRLCEPAYFPVANEPQLLATLTRIACDSVVWSDQLVVYPAALLSRSSNVTCYLQTRPTLFSCAEHSNTLSRVCPCRRFRMGAKLQTALCD